MKEEKYTVEDIFLYGCVVCCIMFVLPFYYIEDPQHPTLRILKFCAVIPLLAMFYTICQYVWGCCMPVVASDDDDGDDPYFTFVSICFLVIFGCGLYFSLAWLWSDNPLILSVGNVTVTLSWMLMLVLSVMWPTIEST